MKKIFFLMILLGFLSSCGSDRMRCGPGRCSVEDKNSVFEEKLPKQMNA
jgi:hypothetical protein